MKHFRAYCSEFIGALFLTLGAMISNDPIVIGLILILVTYIFWSISGAHVNPVITVANMVMRKISAKQGLYYLIAQILGALAAYAIGVIVYKAAGFEIPTWIQDVPSFSGVGFTAEIIAGIIFSMAVAAVAWNRVPSAMSGIVIGGGFILAAVLAARIAAASVVVMINPAVAIAMGRLNIDHLFAPLLGGIIGFALYNWLSQEHKA